MAMPTFKERTDAAMQKYGFEAWFVRWFDKNWELWHLFNDESLKMAKTGRENYSAYTIIEVIRWNHDLASDGTDKFKISNDAIPRLARLFKEVNPKYSTFFKTKPSSNLK